MAHTKTSENAKPQTYLELISVSAEESQKKQLEFRAKEAEQSVSMRILETEKEIFKKEAELDQARRAVPYDIDLELNLVVEIESLQKGLEFCTKIKNERF